MYVERTNASVTVKDSHAWNICNINTGMLEKYLKHQQRSIIWVGVRNHSSQVVVYNHAFKFDIRLIEENQKLIPSSLLQKPIPNQNNTDNNRQ